MNAEKFIKQLYHDIWQGNHINKLDDYYAHDVQITMSVSKDSVDPEDFIVPLDG